MEKKTAIQLSCEYDIILVNTDAATLPELDERQFPSASHEFFYEKQFPGGRAVSTPLSLKPAVHAEILDAYIKSRSAV